MEWGVIPPRNSLQHPLGVLQFNSILTLSLSQKNMPVYEKGGGGSAHCMADFSQGRLVLEPRVSLAKMEREDRISGSSGGGLARGLRILLSRSVGSPKSIPKNSAPLPQPSSEHTDRKTKEWQRARVPP